VGKDDKRTLTPRLRFPGFRKSLGWSVDNLSAVAEFVNERVPIGEIALKDYISTENILPDFGGVTTASNLPPTGSATRFRAGDILVSNIRPYLKKVWASDRDGAASNDVIVIRAKCSISRRFLPFVLKSQSFIDYVMTGAKGVKMPRGDIGLIKGYPVSHPSQPEQQKIADCLTSLDELIAAQGRKVEALKVDKKCLMQQLFPREGETLPRIRLPEFRDAGEWEERRAGTLFANRVNKGEEGLPIYSVTTHDGMVRRDSFDRDFYDIDEAAGNKKACKNDIAYNMMRMWQGALGVAPEDCLVSPAYVVLTPQNDAVSRFFEYLFKLPASLLLLTSHSRGLTNDRLRLYYDDFARIPLLCPSPPEQQRIVDCLSSVGARIAAEADKLAALKTHKKGMMQQLFPAALFDRIFAGGGSL
jgi:type I restriction enzyme, S subunit